MITEFIDRFQEIKPSDYWATRVFYGSCSSCDTFQSYYTYGGNPEDSAPEMVTMALHMIEAMNNIFKD